MEHNTLPGNSQNQKQPQKVQQVATGQVIKPSEGKKIAKAFVGGTFEEVKNHTLYEMIIPGLKKLFLDGISILLYGEVKKPTSPISSASRTSYTSFWSQPVAAPVPKASSAPSIRFEYYDLAYPDKEQALMVREELSNIFDRFNYVSVSDLYELSGLEAPYTANNYGWYDIRSAEVVQTNNPDMPWALKMPKVTQINRK